MSSIKWCQEAIRKFELDSILATWLSPYQRMVAKFPDVSQIETGDQTVLGSKRTARLRDGNFLKRGKLFRRLRGEFLPAHLAFAEAQKYVP